MKCSCGFAILAIAVVIFESDASSSSANSMCVDGQCGNDNTGGVNDDEVTMLQVSSHTAKQDKAKQIKAKETKNKESRNKERKNKERRAKESRNKERRGKESKAKERRSKESRAKQSKAKQSPPTAPPTPPPTEPPTEPPTAPPTPPPTEPPTPNQDGYDKYSGDCPGNNIQTTVKFSVTDCAAACDSDDSCVGFSWAPDYGGACITKSKSCDSDKTSVTGWTFYSSKAPPTPVCTPYSEEACKQAATAMGLSLGGGGYDFAGSYGTKGCYTYSSGKYKGKAYYGRGGSDAAKKAAVSAPKMRVPGYDCSK